MKNQGVESVKKLTIDDLISNALCRNGGTCRRVAAFGIQCIDFPAWLESLGINEYEVYFNDENLLYAAQKQNPAGHCGVYTGVQQIRDSQGDILFAEARAFDCLGKYSIIKKYERVYARPLSVRQFAYLLFSISRYFVSGRRLSVDMPLALAGGRRWTGMTVRRTAAKTNRALERMFLPAAWSYEDLFTALNKEGVDYVVLRWWERLPDIPAGDDVDILVADEHCDKVLALMNRGKPGTRALEARTVSKRDAAYGTVYYEPENAREILAGAISGPCGCKIPAPREAFMSLAYHALYHKGFISRLTSCYGGGGWGKYHNALQKQAAALNVPVDMESLDEFLATEKWRPPMDKLKHLAIKNDWVRQHFFDDSSRT